jgi:hypothetical protein
MTVTVAAGETSTADLSAYLPVLARVRNGARRKRIGPRSSIRRPRLGTVGGRRGGGVNGFVVRSSPHAGRAPTV